MVLLKISKKIALKLRRSQETQYRLIAFLETFSINIGRNIFFREAICTQKDNFDRHFTTFSSTEFILTNFAVRFSGARIMFHGEKLVYEICLDCVIDFNQYNDELVFLEAYSEKIYRRTILKFTDTNN